MLNLLISQRLLKTVLQLRYETTPEQMRYVLAKLRELLLRNPKVTTDPARVRFVGYGAYSKDVEDFAYLRCQDQNTFLAIQEDVLLRMEDIIKEAGTGFAFPSQTAYLTRDTGSDAERRGGERKPRSSNGGSAASEAGHIASGGATRLSRMSNDTTSSLMKPAYSLILTTRSLLLASF